MAKDPKVLEAALKQIRSVREQVDPEVLESAERLARHQMGLPQRPSLALAMLERARAAGGRDRDRVLAELERQVRLRGGNTDKS
ncbi:MAG: hypothetical protein KJ904_02220 [Alphaproteobacteria bacterium]|nr:hypothetical protein [Alphaproteobacteria bacterium]MBU0798689.1 hypothetical protein [Alphaproteobacteria bacterium]MBU0885952.1 hypothetical protein [Alphaproteobacteria bacterium]MBU1811941.1 hypothetical protein [Alphaproteobacteria bacterium]MBU2090577.1 hypothetical protein [Alphaproteobacteria bacterium]